MNFLSSQPRPLISGIAPAALPETAAAYEYVPEKYKALEQRLWNRMRGYNGPFGQDMIEHLNRTSMHFAGLLRAKGYDERIAGNLAQASKFHDAGKILQRESLWGKEDKPTDEEKLERQAHGALGSTVLMQELEFQPELAGDPHLLVMECLMHHHHERINGIGPKGLKGDELGEILEIMGIVDTVDGKTIPRGGQMTSLEQALRDMTGDAAYTKKTKHAGEFRPALLRDAIDYYQEFAPGWILPRPGDVRQPMLAL